MGWGGRRALFSPFRRRRSDRKRQSSRRPRRRPTCRGRGCRATASSLRARWCPPAAPLWRSTSTSTSASGSAKAPHTIRAAQPGAPPRRLSPASTRTRANPCCSCSTTRIGPHAELVAGAYEVVGPRVPLAGGGANAPVGADLAERAGAVRVRPGVSGQRRRRRSPDGGAREIGVGHGCELGALPAIVTRSDGRRILGLDGRPAEQVYLEAIGHPRRRLSDSEFDRLAALHPLAQLELGGRVRPRHVRGRSPGGGLLCATAIPENAAVAFGEQSPQAFPRALSRRREMRSRRCGAARAPRWCSTARLAGVRSGSTRRPRSTC